MLYAFFWVIPSRLNFICQHFGKHCVCSIFISGYVWRMTGFDNVGVFMWEKVWLENSLSQQEEGWQGKGRPAPTLSPSFPLAQAIFKPNCFPHKYSNILKPSHSSYLSTYKDGTERVFRNIGIYNSDAGELPRRKHTTQLHFIFNGYPMNAPSPLKLPTYERTKKFKCPVHSCRSLIVITPLVVPTLYNGLWSDSRSSHFTQLCKYVRHE